MLYLKPLLLLLAGLAVGALLARAGLAWQLPLGWLGAVVLVGWSLLARRRWLILEGATGLEPSPPERMIWMRMCGTALVLGHLTAAIALVGNNLRVGYGNTLAADSWVMVIGWQVAAFLFRRDRKERDERHDTIAAHGYRAGYIASILLLLPLIAWLAFTPRPWRAFFTDFVIANVLIALLIAAYAVMQFVQLVAYARDTR
jgi:hypothetical protein